MVFEKVRELIAEQFSLDENKITNSTAFIEDLGADSLDIVELTMALEEEFGLPEITDEELEAISTVGDLVDYINKFIQD